MMENTKIVNQIKIKISEQEVLRYLGYGKKPIHNIHADIKRIIKEEISQSHFLLDCKGLYQLQNITSISADGMISTKQGYTFFVDEKVIDLLKNAEYLLFAIGTIGTEIEESVKTKFKQNQYMKAMVMDAAGTVAVKTVGKWLNHFIEQKSLPEGLKFSRYFEPGSGDWDIQEQKKVFEILEPEKIGVTLNTSCMMYPAKSLSWIRGMGHDLIDSYRDEFSCQYCLLDHCPFRKRNDT
jgi:hypothetical protein